jgi:hypothetical protein
MSLGATDRLNLEIGSSLVALLVTMVLLGGLTVIALMAESGTSGSKPTVPLPHSPSLGVAPADAGPDISAAAIEACHASYQAGLQAVATYETVNGHPPASVAALQAMLKDPLEGAGFRISLDQTGRVEVAATGHPAAVGDVNCAYA